MQALNSQEVRGRDNKDHCVFIIVWFVGIHKKTEDIVSEKGDTFKVMLHMTMFCSVTDMHTMVHIAWPRYVVGCNI